MVLITCIICQVFLENSQRPPHGRRAPSPLPHVPPPPDHPALPRCRATAPAYSATATAPEPKDNASSRFLGVEAKTLLYTRLTDVLSKEALFYIVIFLFIAFFGAFAYVLYPMCDAIHPITLDDHLLASLGPNFLGFVAILRVWSFYLFYVMAELRGASSYSSSSGGLPIRSNQSSSWVRA
ncbi:ADPATP carrier protein 1 chloroplastic [Zea mays]|uniref:ADP,ATP carrier protein n=1 Tax=Zea mays TaxID=4577 RepID=A0A1D6M2U1_MAIZE|nr:ADPATP carrier protein 1 chloroplastic [Zea mays]AQK85500.1 ADPATP carrier protein 1 chloroplastic [Zea mays]